MSDKCTVTHFKCALTYFKQTQIFLGYLPDYVKYWQNNQKIKEKHFGPVLNSPE